MGGQAAEASNSSFEASNGRTLGRSLLVLLRVVPTPLYNVGRASIAADLGDPLRVALLLK